MEFFHALLQPDNTFLRLSLAVGLAASIAFGIIGTYVVTRRISYLAGAVSHCVLGGIGLSLWTDTRMGNRDLSTNFLFEDRIGAGVRIGNWDLNFRYMHYSNASIKKPNDGIDIFIGSISYRF